MARALVARLVFALAAACALAASMGVAVPPHQEEPGTPLAHDHVLVAYRFAFLMPAIERRPETSSEMAMLHRALAAAGVPMAATGQPPGMDGDERATALPTIKRAGLSPIQDLAVELALLVALTPLLAGPTRRAIAELPLPRVPAALWRMAPALRPPRLVAVP